MKEKTCCFTGHREIDPPKIPEVKKKLRNEITALIEKGYENFVSGGARGFDTLAAQTVLSLKEKYPHIKLILIFPCENQTRGWKDEDVSVYEDIKERADEFRYTSTEYTRGCMHVRNRALVSVSSACICYLLKQSGGTAYTANYALKKGLSVINLA